MGSFDVWLGALRECVASFAVLTRAEGPLTWDRVEPVLDALRLHLRWAEEQLHPLVFKAEGPERAAQLAGALLTLRELMAELALWPPDSVEWQARLIVLEDRVRAHTEALERQILPRLEAGESAAHGGHP